MINNMETKTPRKRIDVLMFSKVTCVLNRAFTAAMLEGKNNTFSLPWEIRSIFM